MACRLYQLATTVCWHSCLIPVTASQVLWELSALGKLGAVLAVAASQRAMQLTWLILLLIVKPFSWILPHLAMSIVALLQVPVAIVDASSMHELPHAPPQARALQWKRRYAHALLLWVARCNVSYHLASIAR